MLLLLLLLAATSPLAQQSDPAACRAIADDRARLACYDAALAQPAGPATTPIAPTATPSAAGAQPTPEALFGQDPVSAGDAMREAAGIETLTELTQRVSATRSDARGRTVLTLDNGQIWAQLDSPPAKLTTGETVTIRRAAFESYLLLRETGGRGIRVRRLR